MFAWVIYHLVQAVFRLLAYLTLQILTKCFRDMNLRKLAKFLPFFLAFFFFLFLSNDKSCHKMQTRYPIVLKFGTQQDSVSAHCVLNFVTIP